MQASTDKPPMYQESLPVPPMSLALRAIVPSGNNRYNRDTAKYASAPVRTIQRNTRPRTFTDDRPLPPGWYEFTHPEGDTYYYHRETGLLTNMDPRNGWILRWLLAAHEQILAKLQTRVDMEVFIELEIPDSRAVVTALYYMVDHRNKLVFWAEDVDVNCIGLPPYESKGHLKSVLTPEYWVHVDYFPAHAEFDKNMAEAEAELFGLLAHGAVDDRTAPGSTCPWSASECLMHLSIIRDFRKFDDKTPYRTATVARLWSAVGRARHINSYGLPNARLDRLQGLVDYTPLKGSFTMTLYESATLFISVSILRRMSTLFNGRVVYHRHWDIFFLDLRGTWLKTSCVGVVILLCDIALIASQMANLATMASASLSGASIFIGLFLHQRHPQWKLATGPDISQYVMSVEDYYQGLRPLSIILALPQTIIIYAALFFQLSLLLVATNNIAQVQEVAWTAVAMSIGLVPLCASVLFFAPAKSDSKPGPLGALRSLLRKWKDPPARGPA